jgi:biotin-(acetyl-CoA carboxylase) ligase
VGDHRGGDRRRHQRADLAQRLGPSTRRRIRSRRRVSARRRQRAVAPAELVEPYLLALGDEIGRLDHADGPADIVSRCRAASPLWGRRVRVDQGGRAVEGLAKDLAEDGGLVVRLLSGADVVIHAGDVRVVWEEA